MKKAIITGVTGQNGSYWIKIILKRVTRVIPVRPFSLYKRQCQEFCVIRIVDLTPFFQRKIFRVT